MGAMFCLCIHTCMYFIRFILFNSIILPFKTIFIIQDTLLNYYHFLVLASIIPFINNFYFIFFCLALIYDAVCVLTQIVNNFFLF